MLVTERKFITAIHNGSNIISQFISEIYREPCIVMHLKMYDMNDCSKFNYYVIRKVRGKQMTYTAQLCENNLIDISWGVDDQFTVTYRGSDNAQYMINYFCF